MKIKDFVDLASNQAVCASKADDTGVCRVNSGGSLSIKVCSVFYYRGIVSSTLFDDMCSDISKFTIFTDVFKLKPWIDQFMREDGEILVPKVTQTNETQIRCTKELEKLNGFMIQACKIENQKIDAEDFSIAADPNRDFQAIHIWNNKEVKFLPENIVECFPRLMLYDVSDCSIKIVNDKYFKALNKLEVLTLQRNEIELIDGNTFKDLRKLQKLLLEQNKIKTIDPNSFQSLENLWELRIGYNKIELLDANIFDNLKNLRLITLNNNKLTTIPANLFKNNLNLEEIFFRENKIQTISSITFDHLTELRYVDLRNSVCVNDHYHQSGFHVMKHVLRTNCTSPV